MFDRIVKRDRAIVMRPALRDVSRLYQGDPHEAMPDHERHSCSLLLCERQKLRRKLTHGVAVECHVARGPEDQRGPRTTAGVLGRLSECFSLFDQPTCSF